MVILAMIFGMMMRAEPGFVAPAGSTRHNAISCQRDHAMTAHDHTTPLEYRDIPGFPGYRVSNTGDVQSCRWSLDAPWRSMSPSVTKSGHLKLILSKEGNSVTITVHTLVLNAFVGPRPDGMECRHLDGNPANNRLENLRWGTSVENQADRVLHGITNRGERYGNAKLTESAVLEIRCLGTQGVTHREIAQRFGVQRGHVSKIIRRMSWAHI